MRPASSSGRGLRQCLDSQDCRRIEYSPAAIYGYFPSKDDIFYALAEEGFRAYARDNAAVMDAALDKLEPLDRIRTIFWRSEFNRQHPRRADVHGPFGPRISQVYERFSFAREMKCTWSVRFRPASTRSVSGQVNARVAFRLLAIGLMGAAMMRLSDRLGPGEDADTLPATS